MDYNQEELPNGSESFQKAVSDVLGANLKLVKRKRKTRLDVCREQFVAIINLYDLIVNTDATLNTLNIDLRSYSSNFYTLIEKIISFAFGEKVFEIIDGYIYNRIGEDGSVQPILIGQEEVLLENAVSLWNFLLTEGYINIKIK